jgi:pilus assembly protein CpaF
MFGKRGIEEPRGGGGAESPARPSDPAADWARPAAGDSPGEALDRPEPAHRLPAEPDPAPMRASEPKRIDATIEPAAEPRRPAARSEDYYDTKTAIFSALIDAIDLAQLAKMDTESARDEIRDIVNEIISLKNVVMSIAEQEELLDDICNDVLGYGPLEPLLARDDIADIMVNAADTVYIEVGGRIEKTAVRFRDNAQLLNVCQRIVSQIGRRVDESSPICDARLPDGSRVNVIVPPLAIDGPALTIRKFKKDKLTLEDLVKYATISREGATVLEVIGRCRRRSGVWLQLIRPRFLGQLATSSASA